MKEDTLFHHGRKTHFSYTDLENMEKCPIVLFSHGYNGCMTDFDETRKKLSENGIASAALTFSGGSTRDKSGFPSTDMTLVSEKEDLVSLIEWALSQEWTDKERIFLFGGSMGGLVSCMAAEEMQDSLRALALLFPALCIVDDWNERFKNESDIPEEMMFWNLLLGKNFFLSMRNMDVFESLSKIALNTLIFHGDKDNIVPLKYSQKAVKTLPNAKLTVFENEGHGFSEEASKTMDQMLIEFINEYK